MKKLFILILMTVACCTVQAQNVVTVKDASNMTAKELKQAAKEQKKKENAIKAEVMAKAAVLKAQKKYQAAQKAAEKAAKKAEQAQKAAEKASNKAESARKAYEKAQDKHADAAKVVE